MESEVEQRVAQHYTHGSLEEEIWAAVVASGADPARVTLADLAPVDEFHIGGRQATADFAAQLEFSPGSALLDIGSGLGGPSRYFAKEQGCRVTGIDLTSEYVAVANALAARVGLTGTVCYHQGSALALPFAAASFDGAYMFHVGMNIADKQKLFAEVRRVLKPGGIFGIYDVMREAEGDLDFPVPWATTAETSFVGSEADYLSLLEGAGFSVRKIRNRKEFAIDFFNQLRARAAAVGEPPPLGLHLLMGSMASQKVANMINNLQRGLIAPVEIVCSAP